MYSGDETGAVVVDAGSYSCKFGYAGDDLPKSVFPGVRCAVRRVFVRLCAV